MHLHFQPHTMSVNSLLRRTNAFHHCFSFTSEDNTMEVLATFNNTTSWFSLHSTFVPSALSNRIHFFFPTTRIPSPKREHSVLKRSSWFGSFRTSFNSCTHHHRMSRIQIPSCAKSPSEQRSVSISEIQTMKNTPTATTTPSTATIPKPKK